MWAGKADKREQLKVALKARAAQNGIEKVTKYNITLYSDYGPSIHPNQLYLKLAKIISIDGL